MVHFENSSFLTTCADVMKPHSAVVRLARKHVEFVRRRRRVPRHQTF